jgi:CelD/BcsL family acetyltransferase involved in cellulose biosynthesis
MKYEVIRSQEQWHALRSQWNSMLLESRANQLFMTWEWLDCWLRVQRSVTDLKIICVRGPGGELLGAAPFYVANYRLLDIVPYRMLRMIGDVDSGAEYQAWIASASDEDRVCAVIARALCALRSEWDLLWIPNLESWTGAHEPMVRALGAGRLGIRSRPRDFSTVTLPADYDAFLANMSPNRRQQVRRNTRKILSKPGVEVRKVTTDAELAPALDALFKLHGKRWRAVGQHGVFDRNLKEREFYECFAPEALARGWLAVYTLFDGSEPKAVQIGYVYGRAFLQLQEGFDPDYSPHVGNALRTRVIQDCIAQGLTEYDFLGGHSEHKRRWLAVERTGMDLLAFTPGLRSIPIRIGVWPRGSYLRPATSKARSPEAPARKPGPAVTDSQVI